MKLTANEVYNMITTECAIAMAINDITIKDIDDMQPWHEPWYNRYNGSELLGEPEDIGYLIEPPWDWLAQLPTEAEPEKVFLAKSILPDLDNHIQKLSVENQQTFLSKIAGWIDFMTKYPYYDRTLKSPPESA